MIKVSPLPESGETVAVAISDRGTTRYRPGYILKVLPGQTENDPPTFEIKLGKKDKKVVAVFPLFQIHAKEIIGYPVNG
jgi:hypothetical protein